MHYLEVLLVFGIVCQVSCLLSKQRVGSKYYYIEDNEMLTWFKAHDKCNSMDAHLISIKNNEEWSAITKYLIPSQSYWTDIINSNPSYNFISNTTGQAAPFLNWFFRYPKHDCVTMKAVGNYMKTKSCYMYSRYICEANDSIEEDTRYKYPILDLSRNSLEMTRRSKY